LAEKERQLAAVGEMGQELIRQQQEMRDAIETMVSSDAAEREEDDEGEDDEDAWVESGLRALQTNLKEYSQNNQTLLAKIQKAVSSVDDTLDLALNSPG
jgi:Skp family chaperone for outer membrane proteins